MFDVSAAQISAAQSGDGDAITDILRAFDLRVTYLARANATQGGHTDTGLMEDLAQEGRIMVWQAVTSYVGSTDPGQLIAYVDKTLRPGLSRKRAALTYTGVNFRAAERYEQALRAAGGDTVEATRRAPDFGLSTEMAKDVRLARQGADSLDTLLDADMPTADPEASDDAERRRQTTQRVRATLAQLHEYQRTVLAALTGVGDVREYGTDNDDELAAEHGIPRDRIKDSRRKGKARFARLYEADFGPVGA